MAAGRTGQRRARAGPRRRPAAPVDPAYRVPTIRLIWADGGYAGKLVDYACTVLGISVPIVTKLAGQVGFVVLPAGGASSGRSPGSTAAAVPSGTTNACPP